MKISLFLSLAFFNLSLLYSQDTIQVFNPRCDDPDPYKIDTTTFVFSGDTLFFRNINREMAGRSDLFGIKTYVSDTVKISVKSNNPVVLLMDCSFGYTVKIHPVPSYPLIKIVINNEYFEVKNPITRITPFDKEKSNKVTIYPNPAKENVFIKIIGNYSNTNFSIINSLGIQVKEGLLGTEAVNIQELPQGLYKVYINKDNRTLSTTFFKE